VRSPKPRLTYANVVSTLCLFVLLGGGAYAASKLPKDSVGPKQLKADAVTSDKVKDGDLLAADFKAGQLPAGLAGPAGPTGQAGPTGPTGPSTGAASGVLSGNYPSPGLSSTIDKLIPVALFTFDGGAGATGVALPVTDEVHRAPLTGAPTYTRTSQGRYDVTLPGLGYLYTDNAAICTTAGNEVFGVGSDSGKLTITVTTYANAPTNAYVQCAVYPLH
jgi:hypothetical protein